MHRLRRWLILLLLTSLHAGAANLAWETWSDQAFARAKRENKFVILDLEAVWCHWCHVMDETTYRDDAVTALLRNKYVTVRVDQDSRPDLSNRYEDYGWPATIVFAADGTEIVRRQGYIPPEEMRRMLQAVIDDPSPGPSVTTAATPHFPSTASLSDAQRTQLAQAVISGYDRAQGAWGRFHKLLDADNVEYCLTRAQHGDEEAATLARDMLRLQRQLVDPVWGGVYQYSAEGDWKHPHFEKIMSIQADNLRTCAFAYALWHDEADRRTGEKIIRYLRTFLTGPEGAYLTSQDADLVPGEHAGEYFALNDAARRSRGIPRVDTNRYARENGWIIAAACAWADATNDPTVLRDAGRAAEWIVAHRSLPGGGFCHGEMDTGGPYLGDTLSMGRACFALYQSTADKRWLDRSAAAADFIRTHFARGTQPGYATVATSAGTGTVAEPQFDESISLARFANLLAHATGRASDRAMAETSLEWALGDQILGRRGAFVGSVLLADEELRTDPVHVMIVGSRNSANTHALFQATRPIFAPYKLVELWDKKRESAPRGENIFPDLPQPSAFLCANGSCSSPLIDAAALGKRLARVTRG